MKPKWLRNERTRLILTLELAVVLPAAALVVLSAWHLTEIQRDRTVEAAFQRDFSQMLAISEKEINHKAYEQLDDVRAEFPVSGPIHAETLDRILAAHPFVAHVFTYDPDQGMVFRSQPYRLANDQSFRAEADNLSKSDSWLKIEYKDLVEKITKMEKKGVPYYAFPNWVSRGERHVYQSIALFVKVDETSGKKSLGGIVFDAEYLRDHFFPGILDTVMSHTLGEGQGEKNQCAIMLHPKGESTPLAASTGWDGGE